MTATLSLNGSGVIPRSDTDPTPIHTSHANWVDGEILEWWFELGGRAVAFPGPLSVEVWAELSTDGGATFPLKLSGRAYVAGTNTASTGRIGGSIALSPGGSPTVQVRLDSQVWIAMQCFPASGDCCTLHTTRWPAGTFTPSGYTY